MASLLATPTLCELSPLVAKFNKIFSGVFTFIPTANLTPDTLSLDIFSKTSAVALGWLATLFLMPESSFSDKSSNMSEGRSLRKRISVITKAASRLFLLVLTILAIVLGLVLGFPATISFTVSSLSSERTSKTLGLMFLDFANLALSFALSLKISFLALFRLDVPVIDPPYFFSSLFSDSLIASALVVKCGTSAPRGHFFFSALQIPGWSFFPMWYLAIKPYSS